MSKPFFLKILQVDTLTWPSLLSKTMLGYEHKNIRKFPSAREFVNIRIVFPRIKCDENKFGSKFCDSQQYLEAAMNNLTKNTDSMQKATSQNSSFLEFELLKNIDQPISVILVFGEGRHIYIALLRSWLACLHEYLKSKTWWQRRWGKARSKQRAR